MSGWRLWQELCARRAQAAVTVAAVGVAVASLCTVALGSTSATGRETRSRSVDQAAALAIGRDGKLLVAGVSGRQYEGDFALARYTGSGRLDRSFGMGGKVVTSFGRGDDAGARSLAVGPDGKIVVAGGAIVPPRLISAFAIARYAAGGKLDRTFGRDGKVLTHFALGASGLAVQADGKVVAVGATSRGFALARYTRRGKLDRSFGREGKVVTSFAEQVPSNASANAVAIQPNGKIVVAGLPIRRIKGTRGSRLPATTPTAHSIGASAIATGSSRESATSALRPSTWSYSRTGSSFSPEAPRSAATPALRLSATAPTGSPTRASAVEA